jgi:hypothetical protein
VESLFEAVIVGLGGVKLIKTEDVGQFYCEEHDGGLALPDYRIVTATGEHLLVEVKGVPPNAVGKALKVRAKDLDAEQRYADMTSARLLVATYWSWLNVWTMVDATVLERTGNYKVLSFETALVANELALLGDANLGTKPPLQVAFAADLERPRGNDHVRDDQRELNFFIADVELYCDGQRIVDPVERRIAWFSFSLVIGKRISKSRLTKTANRYELPLASPLTIRRT